jgi:hypothetical protein
MLHQVKGAILRNRRFHRLNSIVFAALSGVEKEHSFKEDDVSTDEPRQHDQERNTDCRPKRCRSDTEN